MQTAPVVEDISRIKLAGIKTEFRLLVPLNRICFVLVTFTSSATITVSININI